MGTLAILVLRRLHFERHSWNDGKKCLQCLLYYLWVFLDALTFGLGMGLGLKIINRLWS